MSNDPLLIIQRGVNALRGPDTYVPPNRLAVYYAVALQEINAAREALGLLPLDAIPAGKQRNCSNCPLAIALRGAIPMARVNLQTVRRMRPEQIQPLVDAWGTYTYRPCGEDVVGISRSMSHFLHLFDNDHWPELVIPPHVKIERD